MGLEYANLFKALEALSLASSTTSETLSRAFVSSSDRAENHARGLELGELILKALDDYPKEVVDGQTRRRVRRVY